MRLADRLPFRDHDTEESDHQHGHANRRSQDQSERTLRPVPASPIVNSLTLDGSSPTISTSCNAKTRAVEHYPQRQQTVDGPKRHAEHVGGIPEFQGVHILALGAERQKRK